MFKKLPNDEHRPPNVSMDASKELYQTAPIP
jgi:hypothetical protein